MGLGAAESCEAARGLHVDEGFQGFAQQLGEAGFWAEFSGCSEQLVVEFDRYFHWVLERYCCIELRLQGLKPDLFAGVYGTTEQLAEEVGIG